MKSCSYCGKQYADDVEVCLIDQRPLIDSQQSRAGVVSPKVICPKCGATDGYVHTVEKHSSFSLFAFLAGGIPALIFRNAGMPRRVRCNRCDGRFYIHRPLAKLSRIIYWLLVYPTIIALVLMLVVLVLTAFLH